jgi:hypothetical protein
LNSFIDKLYRVNRCTDEISGGSGIALAVSVARHAGAVPRATVRIPAKICTRTVMVSLFCLIKTHDHANGRGAK